MPMNNKRKSIYELASSSKKIKLVAKLDLDSSIEEEEEECLDDMFERAFKECGKKYRPSSEQEEKSDSVEEDLQDLSQDAVKDMLLSPAKSQSSDTLEPPITIAELIQEINEVIDEVGEDDDNGGDEDGGGDDEEEKQVEEESNSTENAPKYIRNTNRKVSEPLKFEKIPIPPWLGSVRPKFVLKFARPASITFLDKSLAPKVLPAPAFPAVTTKLIATRRETPAEREIQENDIGPAPATSQPKVKEVYVCEKCNKPFQSKNGFKNHQKIHNDDREFQCEQCNKAFTSKTCLKTHVKNIHSGQTYTCPHCPKVLKTAHYMRTHMKTHTLQKDFACSHCEKKFIDMQSLTVHMPVHTGERKYECDVCAKKFKQINHLKTHKRIHLGEKPYKCDMCESAFTQKSGLNNHKSRFH